MLFRKLTVDLNEVMNADRQAVKRRGCGGTLARSVFWTET
jgi:hypothetical protein